MNSNNVVSIQGRIPFNLELKTSQAGKSYLNFKVSVKRNFKGKDEKYYTEDMVNCKAFGKIAENINRFYDKGSAISVLGEYRVDKITDKDEKVTYFTYVLVDNASFVNGNTEKVDNNNNSEEVSDEYDCTDMFADTSNDTENIFDF